MLMVDRLEPPTDAEIAALRAAGIGAIAPYYGGKNRNPNPWTRADAVRCRNGGLLVMGIRVEENVCGGCKTPVVLTRGQGAADAAAGLAAARAFGGMNEPLSLDIEYETYTSNPAACLSYMEGWAFAVESALVPVHYAPLVAASDYRVAAGHRAGGWFAAWDGVGDLSKIPNAGQWVGVGQQYADNWVLPGIGSTWDISHVDEAWWGMTAGPMEPVDTSVTFPDYGGPHVVGGGIYQSWKAAGGLAGPGKPLNDEHPYTAQDGLAVTAQDFERGRAEYHASLTEPWSVRWGLVNLELLDARAKLAASGAGLQRVIDAQPLAAALADTATRLVKVLS